MATIAANATPAQKREWLLSDFNIASSAIALGAMLVLIGYFINDFGGKTAFWAGIGTLGFAFIKLTIGISKLSSVTR